MITKKDKVVNSLLSCVSFSGKDKTEVRINIENVFHILISEYGYVFSKAQYEATLEHEIATNLPDNLPASHAGRYIIATALYKLAEKMHIPKELILKYKLSNNIE